MYGPDNGFDFDADNILHFRLRPDPLQPWRGIGPQIQLQQVVDSIIQTAETKTAYMSSEYKPPIVISVNSDSPLSDPEKRSMETCEYINYVESLQGYAPEENERRISFVDELLADAERRASKTGKLIEHDVFDEEMEK